MTKLLEKEFDESSKLPVAMQDLIAQRLLEDIESEAKWEEAFANSQDELAQMADEAVKSFRHQ